MMTTEIVAQPVQLTGIEIRQDVEGRYCLNDLHRAAGAESRHQPGKWLETQSASELVTECEKLAITGIPVISAKQGLGTFVIKDLVYAYAMWVSPAFHLQVIRTFDAVQQKVTTFAIPQQKAAAILEAELHLSALLGIPLHLAQLEAIKTVHRETGLDYRPLLALAPAQNNVAPEDVMLEPADLAKRLNIKDGATVNKWLAECGLQRKEGASWVATETGQSHSMQHQWSTTFKSGYNLKWSLAYIRSLLPKDWPALT